MSISENIAKYRKQKSFTQEQLGERLGVSNQAVSKWESGVSLPDVMLLPKIAEVLGTTLNGLYGIGELEQQKDKNTLIDEFPLETQNLIKTHLYKRILADTETLKDMLHFEYSDEGKAKINSTYTLGVHPYTSNGVAFISDGLSVVSSSFEAQNCTDIFNSAEISSGMKKLCDPNVRKVLAYMYSESLKKAINGLSDLNQFFDMHGKDFSLNEIYTSCDLSEDETLEALEKLIAIHIVVVNQTKYYFNITKGIETAVTFKVLERLIRESFGWGCGYIVGHIEE